MSLPSSALEPPDNGGAIRSTTARLRRRLNDIELRGSHHTRSSNLLHRLGDWSSKAAAGVTIACIMAGWGVVGVIAGFPSWWQVALYSTTSAVTVVMVFAIQHTQHREQLVTQRKLDELLRAQPEADDRLIAAEAATDDELDHLIEANDGVRSSSPPDTDDARSGRDSCRSEFWAGCVPHLAQIPPRSSDTGSNQPPLRQPARSGRRSTWTSACGCPPQRCRVERERWPPGSTPHNTPGRSGRRRVESPRHGARCRRSTRSRCRRGHRRQRRVG